MKPYAGADISLCDGVDQQCAPALYPTKLCKNTGTLASDIKRLFFLPTVSSLHPVFCLCVCFPGYGTKRSWGSRHGRDHKNKNRKRGLCWAWPIASECPEPVHSLQEQRGFGKALALQSVRWCSPHFLGPNLATEMLGPSIVSGRSTNARDCNCKQNGWVPFCAPFVCWHWDGSIPTSHASIGCVRLSSTNLGPRNPPGKEGFLKHVKAVKLPLLMQNLWDLSASRFYLPQILQPPHCKILVEILIAFYTKPSVLQTWGRFSLSKLCIWSLNLANSTAFKSSWLISWIYCCFLLLLFFFNGIVLYLFGV